jgi:hypothetical protein
MRRMLIGPIISLFVVVAVAAISARSISHSFRAQASPDSTQAIEKRERKDAEKTQLSSTPGQEGERKFAEAHEQAEQKRLKQETEQRQAEIKLLKEQVNLTLRREVKRWFAQARRQADQQRRQRETELRKQEKERKLAEARHRAEQRRLLQEAKQQKAALRRKQQEERKLLEVRRRERILEEAKQYFEKRLEEQRTLAKAQLQEEEQRRYAAEQQPADVKRLQEEGPKLGLRRTIGTKEIVEEHPEKVTWIRKLLAFTGYSNRPAMTSTK